MSSKTKELFEVTFWAKKRVKAFTHEEASTIVENMKDIKLVDGIDSKVTTNTKFDTFAQNAVMQIPVITTGLVGILWVSVAIHLTKIIDGFSEEARVIGLICLVTSFMVTFRFPNTVGRWFKGFKGSRY